MGETKDVLTIYTNVGYAKVICAAETTVKEMINMAMRTVSLSTASQLYGLRMPHKCKNASQPFRHILCRKLTWERLKSLYNPKELILSICLYPTKFEEAARNDRTTLFYLHQQARELYYARFSEIQDVDMAFEIGCLDIRSIVFSPNILPKDLMELVEKARPLHSFFPPCVTQQYKGKSLRRLVQSYLYKVKHYTEEDCVLDMLNRYLILLQFDRDVIRCSFGTGPGIPADLIIGPRFQVSINIDNARQPHLLAYFASIRKVLVSRIPDGDNERFQVRLAVEQSSDPNAPLETISFTFHSQEAADTAVHLLEGYCGESIGAALQDSTCESAVVGATQRAMREEFLPNGCPYWLHESNDLELKRLEIPRENIILEQVLGEGQFGDVYKGSYQKSLGAERIVVAVKTCKMESSVDERKQFLEEASIMNEFNHPHIIRLFGICSDNPIWLVMEYAPLGEMRHYMLANRDRVPLSMRLTFCYQIVSALCCLEEKRCVHRDIAARNILVAREDWVKLADFGMARMLNDANEFNADKGRKMPIKWMSPESIQQRRFSSASDVWMFGVCMWEIVSGGIKPFVDLTNAEAAELVLRGQRLKRLSNCPPNLYVLMLECWNTNPQRRPTFASLKPKLRELVAQSRSIGNFNNQNYDMSGSSEQSDLEFSSSQKPVGESELINNNSASKSGVGVCSSYRSKSEKARRTNVHSNWEEVTQLEPRPDPLRFETKHNVVLRNSGSASPDNCGANQRTECIDGPRKTAFTRSLSAGSSRTALRQRSPQRAVNFNLTDSAGSRNADSHLHGAPNISREPSPRRKTMTALCLDKFLQMNDHFAPERPKSAQPGDDRPRTPNSKTSNSSPMRTEFASTFDVQRAQSATPTYPSSSGTHSRFDSTGDYTQDSPDDPIYSAAVKVIQTVRVASQQLVEAPPDQYGILAKSIGAAVKDLFVSVESSFVSGPNEQEIFLAERQLNASMYHLISTIKDANLATNRGLLLEEFRRHLMTLAYVVANDAHALYTAAHEYRSRNQTNSRT